MRVPTVKTIQAKTAFNTPETARAAQACLRWLEAGAPEGEANLAFNMGEYVNSEVEGQTSDCGTACCIAGFMDITLGRAKLGEYNGLHTLNTNWSIPDGNRMDHPLYRLFYATERLRPGMSNIPPEGAARVLRHYLTTGEVDWTQEDLV